MSSSSNLSSSNVTEHSNSSFGFENSSSSSNNFLSSSSSSSGAVTAHGLSTGAIVGIAVALGGLLLLLVMAMALCFVWKKRRRDSRGFEHDAVFGDGASEMLTLEGVTSESIGAISARMPLGKTASSNEEGPLLNAPRYHEDASKLAEAELKMEDDAATTCTITELLDIGPKKPTFGRLVVDDPKPSETLITLTNATLASGNRAIEVFVVGYGGKAFRITFPVTEERDGTIEETVSFHYTIMPGDKLDVIVHAVACCSTTTTRPHIFIAAKTKLCENNSSTTATARRWARRKMGTATSSAVDFDAKKSTKAIAIHAQVEPGPKIDPDEIEFDKLVGEGSFGKVYRAKWKGNVVAVKTFKLAGYSENVAKDVIKEASIQSNMKNPYVVMLYGVIIDEHIAIVTEFFELGGLDVLITRANTTPAVANIMTPLLRARYASDIAMGMAYLAASNIVHRDLKPGNILVASTNPMSDSACCKLTDFGTARTVIDSDDTSATCTRGVGTPLYMAPEVLLYDNTKPCYTEASDVYSFSILCYQLFTGCDPFPGDAYAASWKISEAVTSGGRPNIDVVTQKIPDKIGEALARIVMMCWNRNPEERPAFSAIADMLVAARKLTIGMT